LSYFIQDIESINDQRSIKTDAAVKEINLLEDIKVKLMNERNFPDDDGVKVPGDDGIEVPGDDGIVNLLEDIKVKVTNERNLPDDDRVEVPGDDGIEVPGDDVANVHRDMVNVDRDMVNVDRDIIHAEKNVPYKYDIVFKASNSSKVMLESASSSKDLSSHKIRDVPVEKEIDPLTGRDINGVEAGIETPFIMTEAHEETGLGEPLKLNNSEKGSANPNPAKKPRKKRKKKFLLEKMYSFPFLGGVKIKVEM